MEKTYEDGYEAGFKDGKEAFDEDAFNSAYDSGWEEGRVTAFLESREFQFRKAVQAFHMMYHTKGSYTFEKCWDEPCRSVRQ